MISLLGNSLAANYKVFIIVAGECNKETYKLDKRISILQLEDERPVKNKYLQFLILCRNYVSMVRKIQPDLVISFLPKPCIISTMMRFFVNSPLICAERSNPYFHYKGLMKVVVNFLFGLSDMIICQSAGAYSFFSKRVRNKAVIIGNPIKIDVYAETVTPGKIVAVGRHTPEKNYCLLIKAFDIVQRYYTETRLFIYGRLDKSSDVCKLIADLGLKNKVELKGQVDDIPANIKDAEVYVLSSKSEGMPNALLEAMAMGLPCVATDCPAGGVRELVKNGVNGVLVRNDDVSELADAIMFLMRDKEKAQMMGKEAKKVADRFGYDKILNEWDIVIDKVIKTGAKL